MSSDRISRRHAGDRLQPGPVFVLDRPQMGENIGASARAMLNFGLSGLRLACPRDGWPNTKAAATASGASVVLDRARVFDSLPAAISDCQFVLATTARRRELSLPVYSPEEAAVLLRERVDRGEVCAVLFGGEANGLESDDVARAHGIISAPVNPAFASLNLSQAVLLVAYEWSQTKPPGLSALSDEEQRAAKSADVERLYNHLETVLDETGYFFPPEMRSPMTRTLRTAITRAGFTEGEVRTFRGILKRLALKKGKS